MILSNFARLLKSTGTVLGLLSIFSMLGRPSNIRRRRPLSNIFKDLLRNHLANQSHISSGGAPWERGRKFA